MSASFRVCSSKRRRLAAPARSRSPRLTSSLRLRGLQRTTIQEDPMQVDEETTSNNLRVRSDHRDLSPSPPASPPPSPPPSPRQLERDNDPDLPWDNFTHGALHLFFELSGVSQQTMAMLLELLRSPDFNLEDVPRTTHHLKVRLNTA